MTIQSNNSEFNNEGSKKMTQRSISIDMPLWNKAKEKAGMIPISAIIRKLLQLWVSGDLDDYFKK